MKKSLVKTFLILILIVPALSFSQCIDDDSFSKFYAKFRATVDKGDGREVVRLIQFPFKVREVLSDEMPMNISKAQFFRYYKYVMQLPVKRFPADKGVTQRELILASTLRQGENFSCTEVDKKEILSNKARVGLFDFYRRRDGLWRLSDAMISGDLYSDIEEDSEPVD